MALADDHPNPSGKDQWSVGSLRATTFITNLSTDDAIENTWWNETVGIKPKDEHINHQTGTKEQTGSLHGNRLVMVSQPGQVNWIHAVEELSETAKLPALGPMSTDTLDRFMAIVKKWLNVSPPINRLAFGVTLGSLTADIRTGYESIQPYIPAVQLNRQGIADFFYRINNPIESKVRPGTMINRLSSWTVTVWGTVGVTIEPTASLVTTDMPRRQHICRLDLDINTASLDGSVVKNDAYLLFRELIEHGLAIADKGDTL